MTIGLYGGDNGTLMREDRRGEIRLEKRNRKEEEREKKKKRSREKHLLFSHLLHVAAIMLAAVVS